MLRLATAALLLSGCVLYLPDDNEKCDVAAPAYVPAPIRNPDTLVCESYGQPPSCNPECGPCPAFVGDGAGDLAPIPTWGVCGSSCEGLGESACAARSDCRVTKDAWCTLAGDCETDFLGCFPTDMTVDATIDCERADSWQCSRNSSCTAYHRGVYPHLTDEAPQQTRPFAFCADEGTDPGRCYDVVGCRAAPPACPANTMPAVANGCYTGVCIPTEFCELAPNH